MSLALSQFSPESLDGRRGKLAPRLFTLLFFALATVLLIAGITAFAGAYARSSDMPDGFAWKPLADQVSNRALDPATALFALTDVSALEALNQSFESGDMDSALALVAYDPRLADAARIGALLQLGTQYSAAKNLRLAAWCYQSAALLATLSPALADFSRIEIWLTASAGLRAADAKDAARRVLDQAYLAAVYSSTLRRQQRVNRLNQIANVYESLNLAGIADQARNKAQEAASAPDAPPASARTPFIPIPGSLPISSTLTLLKQRRTIAATQLLDDVATDKPKSPNEWPQDSMNQLRYALLKEDEVRKEYYAQYLPAARDSFQQIALLTDQVNWLALKRRVARGGFGANIVPEWTKNTNAINDELSDVWNDLFDVFQTQTNALSNPQDVNQAAEDILKQELVGARWGWSQQSEIELRAALTEVTAKMRDSAAPALRLDAAARNNRTLYLLVPDELLGQGALVFPR